MSDTPLVSVHAVVKEYSALRPLRIEELTLNAGDIVSLVGLDAPGAEVLVGMLTGALLPDKGEIRLFGQSTAVIADSDAWLVMLDGVGILTERAALIEQFTVQQNIAMPFSLDIDPITAEVRPLVDALAREVGIPEAAWDFPVARAGAEMQARARLARAIALTPRVLLAEHPSASLARDDVARYAEDLARIARQRQLAVLAVTADTSFARALGGEILMHEPATGALRPLSRWRKLFG